MGGYAGTMTLMGMSGILIYLTHVEASIRKAINNNKKVPKLGHCPKVGTLSQQGEGGSDRRVRMSQPTYLIIFLGGLKLCFREEKN